jgi:outer membrane protein OmpA-like peptidoglycan-associated protein
MRNSFFCIFLFVIVSLSAKAQSFQGYRTNNYTGVNGVFFNPANIADSRYKWDVNVFAIDGYAGNDQNTLKFKDITRSFNADSLKSKLLTSNGDNLTALSRVDILGPSFMFSASKKTSFAVTTRTRVWANATNIDGRLARAVIDAGEVNNANYPYNFNVSKGDIHTAGWTELGLSWGQVLTNSDSRHQLKFGLTAKYLAGVADAYLRQSNLNGSIVNVGGQTQLTNMTGSIQLNTTDANFADYKFRDFFKFNGNGFGGDVGIVYEYRPDMDYSEYEDDRAFNKYKLRVGVSVMDIGQIKFKKSTNDAANYNVAIPPGGTFALSNFQDRSVSEYTDVLNASPYFTNVGTGSTEYKISIPTTVQANVDYNINDRWFVNLAGQIATSKTEGLNLYAFNSYTLTPRYDVERFGISVPINYNELTDFNAGISFRFGPVFLGSGSVITALFDNNKQADLHLGVRFGMPYKKVKKTDTDGDGIYDKEDQCPTVPGVARYNGCPVPDRDGDGVNDEEDKCPDEPGLARYQGCPIPDRDGDGINDEIDECPDQPGSGQFKGCPDTDGDGIPDKDDKCPTVAGVAKYQGCPIPDRDGDGINDEEDLCPDKPGPASSRGCPVEEVAVRITADFKNILFDFGKATIRPESLPIIERAAQTMNEQIPNSTFYIDGYTDNKGSVQVNKKISQQRAQAVASALIAAGVEKSRLTARGFGKDNPKCENDTEEGRQCNRRVEVVIRNIDQKQSTSTIKVNN